MAYLKTEAPVFMEGETIESRIRRIGDYQKQLRQELDYVLTHLGSGNMNAAGLSITVSDAEGAEAGAVGLTDDGVGIAAEGAMVTAKPYKLTLTAGDTVCTLDAGGAVVRFGDYGLRITESGIEKTSDGGGTWGSI